MSQVLDRFLLELRDQERDRNPFEFHLKEFFYELSCEQRALRLRVDHTDLGWINAVLRNQQNLTNWIHTLYRKRQYDKIRVGLCFGPNPTCIEPHVTKLLLELKKLNPA